MCLLCSLVCILAWHNQHSNCFFYKVCMALVSSLPLALDMEAFCQLIKIADTIDDFDYMCLNYGVHSLITMKQIRTK